jgi:hypothetical protein
MKSNIISEFEMIQRTTFWQKYLEKIDKKIKANMITAVTSKLADAAPECRGAHRAYETIEGIPAEILRDENAKSGPKQDNLGKGPSKSD